MHFSPDKREKRKFKKGYPTLPYPSINTKKMWQGLDPRLKKSVRDTNQLKDQIWKGTKPKRNKMKAKLNKKWKKNQGKMEVLPLQANNTKIVSENEDKKGFAFIEKI